MCPVVVEPPLVFGEFWVSLWINFGNLVLSSCSMFKAELISFNILSTTGLLSSPFVSPLPESLCPTWYTTVVFVLRETIPKSANVVNAAFFSTSFCPELADSAVQEARSKNNKTCRPGRSRVAECLMPRAGRRGRDRSLICVTSMVMSLSCPPWF